MLVIRPLQQSDLEDLYTMAQRAGKGLTSLPADRDMLQRKINQAQETFNQRCAPEAGLYLFALEDTDTGKAVGISGIQARVGLDEVFYNYRLSVTVNASKELGVHVRTPTLHLSNDMTDTSEICSLLLSSDYHGGGNGLLLSRCRFMFLDEFRKHFSEKVFAEMRGVSDEQGMSPLWDALGSKFFDMEFIEADMLSGLGNKSFIAELMPKYPIYLPMLPDSARAVIGRVHGNTAPALTMLKAEGFNFNGMVDIFDGGPVVEAFVHTIRTVRDSFNRYASVTRKAIDLDVPADKRVMISNRSFRNFRVTTVPASCVGIDTVSLPPEVAEALQIESGDPVRLAPLKERSQAPAKAAN
ncbi:MULTISPECIES: arginine N-succinyltransferase [Marinobacter]|uniref:Arginine N-succinyltransferase n=1 Tax=Marinobacter xiaoshiensis TaxID=3073652 RepID=A0ABU2HJN4_9GAMM|nr:MULTISPECIES: arginine N-succinyltransferase [unclassified Marinobacter]MBK1873843.1 arginine N-succinyltransferase [Marinobacter sp. 1-3A]MBK1886157.1 arginine N-succinyltransferase [Marinobacter sp. DY40_1A1]MDS1311267.1 arginine N-succinyltransferase [Marinobacter sp. F60267]